MIYADGTVLLDYGDGTIDEIPCAPEELEEMVRVMLEDMPDIDVSGARLPLGEAIAQRFAAAHA
jgi:hypothetical protein